MTDIHSFSHFQIGGLNFNPFRCTQEAPEWAFSLAFAAMENLQLQYFRFIFILLISHFCPSELHQGKVVAFFSASISNIMIFALIMSHLYHRQIFFLIFCFTMLL